MNKKELINIIRSGRATGQTTGIVLEIVGRLLQHPGLKLYLRSTEELRRMPPSFYEYTYSDHYDTIMSIRLSLIPKIFDIIKDLNIKGIIFDKSNRSLVYDVEKYIDELEKE